MENSLDVAHIQNVDILINKLYDKYLIIKYLDILVKVKN